MITPDTLAGDVVHPAQIPAGTTFGRYVVESCLGAGGMAAVYRARHAELGRVVALKVMHPELAKNDAHVQRFLQEARAASSLRHPHVADVSDVGAVGGRAYIVMEYLEGRTLAQRLERLGPMSTAEIADLMLPVLSAVAAAHSAGIIHRDIKPENIFLASDARGEDRPVLLDFGISKTVGAPRSKALTEVGQFVGTPYYMSPEQIQQREAVDGRSDQYALGVVMYECATGVLPFRSEQSLFVLLAEIVFGKPEPPTSHVPAMPRPFERVILRAMSSSRDERFASIEALARALLPFATPAVQSERGREFKGDPFTNASPDRTSFRPSQPPPPTAPGRPSPAPQRRPQRSPVTLTGLDLRVVSHLESCSEAELGAFLLAATAYRYPKGARLFAQGEEADACYIVLHGEVEIVKDIAGSEAVLNVLGPGEIVGQIALVDDALRSATVVARTDVSALSIGRDVFHRLLGSGSPIAMRLQELVAISGIRQLRKATRRFSKLLEERAAAAPEEADEIEARQTPRLEHLRAAVSEWSVRIGSR